MGERAAAVWVAVAALASACAAPAGPPYAGAGAVRIEAEPRGDAAAMALVSRMIERGRLRAALAHLEALPDSDAASPRARWLRAECLRRLDRPADARRELHALLDTAFAADAQRGLGLLAAAEGEVGDAIRWLESARAERPTDPRIRNDLGYALLIGGRVAESEEQLRTALDLGAGDRAAINLVLLLLVRGDEQEARAQANRAGLSGDRIERLVERARGLRGGLERIPTGGSPS